MLSLTQAVGGASPGGMDALLNRTTLEGLVAASGDGNDDLWTPSTGRKPLVDESVMPQQVSQHP